MTLGDILDNEPDWDKILVYSDFLEDRDDLAGAAALRALASPFGYRAWPVNCSDTQWSWQNPPMGLPREFLGASWWPPGATEWATLQDCLLWYMDRHKELFPR